MTLAHADVNDVLTPTDPARTDALLAPPDTFPRRHVGPDAAEQRRMLDLLGVDSIDELMRQAVPADIRLDRDLKLDGLPAGLGESAAIGRLREMAERRTSCGGA